MMSPNPDAHESIADAINRIVRDLRVVFRGTKDGALQFEPIFEVSDDELDALLDAIDDTLSEAHDARVEEAFRDWKINSLAIVRRNEALVVS